MPTARSIIKGAMRVGGIITHNETPSSDEFNDALEVLNGLLGVLSNESLFIRSRTIETFNLTTATTYTIGVGADFNTVPPLNIISATVKIGTIDYEINEISDEQYNAISLKTVGGIPSCFNYNAGFPIGVIKLYPAPTAVSTITFVSEKPITSVGIDDNLDLSSGWDMMLRYNLAMMLLTEYGQPVTQELTMLANKYKGSVSRNVAKNRVLSYYPNARRGSIYDGWA